MKNLNFRISAMTLSFFLFSALHSAFAGSQKNDQAFQKLLEKYTEAIKHLDAYNAPYFNLENDLENFGDYPSDEALQRQKDLVASSLKELNGLKQKDLSDDAKLTYQIFKEDLEIQSAGQEFPIELLEFNQMSNRIVSFISQANPALSSFPFDTKKHYLDFVKRAHGFPSYVERQIQLLRRGVQEKVTLNCRIVEKTSNSYKAALETQIEKNPFWKPILALPKDFSETDKAEIQSQFKDVIEKKIIPSLIHFNDYFTREYAKNCRQGYGIGSLAQSKAWYRWAIWHHTDQKQDPMDLHKLGLSEVERIEHEISQVQGQLKIPGDRKQFLKEVLHHSEFFFSNEEALVNAFEKTKLKIAEKLPGAFKRLPKSDFQIVRSENPEDTSGVYKNPTEMRPIGRFIYSAANVRRIPVYRVTTLLMHETSPGHHLQLGLAFEMSDKLPEYRRKIFHSTAFIEGWALYAEYLGRELGLFDDPVQKLGHLDDELLRAVRLVVDTGIHWLNWDHDKSIDYMSQHLAADEAELETSANRYSVFPGQALAYKSGQLKIIGLRHQAEAKLGKNFDLKEFHSQVLNEGTVSISTLEQRINRWIASSPRKK